MIYAVWFTISFAWNISLIARSKEENDYRIWALVSNILSIFISILLFIGAYAKTKSLLLFYMISQMFSLLITIVFTIWAAFDSYDDLFRPLKRLKRMYFKTISMPAIIIIVLIISIFIEFIRHYLVVYSCYKLFKKQDQKQDRVKVRQIQVKEINK